MTCCASRVTPIGMRRTLSVNVSRCISYSFYPVLAARTAARVQGVRVDLHRKLATEPPNMDLSSMRKKYKGDEEVSGCQSSRFPCDKVYNVTNNHPTHAAHSTRSNLHTANYIYTCFCEPVFAPLLSHMHVVRQHLLQGEAGNPIGCCCWAVRL